MRQIRLLLSIIVVAAFWYATLTDTAAVRSEILARKIRRSLGDASGEISRIRRAVETGGGDAQNKRICYNMPCGWAVYVPFTRSVDYFMKNTCECPDKTFKCVRTGDDLSVSAYVYRCRQNTTADDIESPEDVN
ncbi:uncharacterized protein [Prorops nasuta]|uniref:uncharacterized protein n=1 Tax=Prorops nasuta TaxID=863751 RepID=UPI0034CDFDEB